MNVCNLISNWPNSLYLHMKRDKQFMLSGRKEKSFALTTFEFSSWSRFCEKREQSSIWKGLERFYIIGNFLLLEKNCILISNLREKKKCHLIYFLHHLSFYYSLFLPTFSNDFIAALLMFINYISPKHSGYFLAYICWTWGC